jgi:hypothetical protein
MDAPPPIEIEKLALPSSPTLQVPHKRHKVPRHKAGDRFLKGPVPWNWITAAAKLRGKALQVAVALWFLAGLKRSGRVALPLSSLAEMGVDRFAASRGLAALEKSGLISVIRHSGRKPIVTLLDVKPYQE